MVEPAHPLNVWKSSVLSDKTYMMRGPPDPKLGRFPAIGQPQLESPSEIHGLASLEDSALGQATGWITQPLGKWRLSGSEV